MSNLDNIIQKIQEDAKAQESAILKDAEDKKDVFQNQRIADANNISRELRQRTDREVGAIRDNVVSSAELKARDRRLAAKQIVVDRVIESVKEQLKNLDDQTYLAYLKKSLSEMDIPAGSTLIVPQNKRAAVEKAGLGYQLSDENIQSGFAVDNGNVRLNNDFESLIEFQKDDLETEIVEKLFQK